MIELNPTLSPDEQIKYLKDKKYNLTFDYDEMKKEAHHEAFTVAKVTKLDLLRDIHNSLIKAQENGQDFDAWKKELIPTLKSHGWWGEQTIKDPKSGKEKTISVNSKRLQTIFQTNLRTSYHVARFDSIKKSGRKYLRYNAILDTNTRPKHKTKHGLVFHIDDPFWQKNYPPNGWNCRCFVTAHSENQVKSNNWSVSKDDKITIADKDWDYDTRRPYPLNSINKIQLDKSIDDLPKTNKKDEYDKLTNEEFVDLFYKKLGIKQEDTFLDKVNDPMVINNQLFLDKKKNKLKVRKQQRQFYLDYLVEAIKDPDEMYLEYDNDNKRLVKKMLKYFTVDGNKRATIAIFGYDKDKTIGVSVYFVTKDEYVENKRSGKLIYKRESQ
jgi:SPP1 gp7 family putative phage head morphogenesis protein